MYHGVEGSGAAAATSKEYTRREHALNLVIIKIVKSKLRKAFSARSLHRPASPCGSEDRQHQSHVRVSFAYAPEWFGGTLETNILALAHWENLYLTNNHCILPL